MAPRLVQVVVGEGVPHYLLLPELLMSRIILSAVYLVGLGLGGLWLPLCIG